MSTQLSAVFKEFQWSTEAPLVAGKKSDGSETGRAEPHDLPLSGCSVTPVGPEVLQCADDIICND